MKYLGRYKLSPGGNVGLYISRLGIIGIKLPDKEATYGLEELIYLKRLSPKQAEDIRQAVLERLMEVR